MSVRRNILLAFPRGDFVNKCILMKKAELIECYCQLTGGMDVFSVDGESRKPREL